MDERDQTPGSPAADEAVLPAEEQTADAAPQEQAKEETRQLRGLYRYVKISVKTLDKIIAVGVIAIIAVIVFGVSHNGYQITFDSNGGTDIAGQTLKYGEYVEEPADPTREGYTFGGWYTDEGCTQQYNFQDTTVYNDLTLYAEWEPAE